MGLLQKHLKLFLGIFMIICATALLISTSDPVPDHPFFNDHDFLIIAHRGGAGLWPENTLYAFEHAAEFGVDVIELDIHLAGDNQIVVIHDDTVDRTTNGNGLVSELTTAELQALDAGYSWTEDTGETYPFRGKGITIPTFEEVLMAFPGSRLNIEIKSDDPSIVVPFCQLIQQYDRADQILVGSFHDDISRKFREVCPDVADSGMVLEVTVFYLLNNLFLGVAFHPSFEVFEVPEYMDPIHVTTERFVTNAQKHNIKVIVWTVNREEDITRIIGLGVDGIITDYPDRLIQILER